MAKIFLLLLISLPLSAATINLKAGESITIKANQNALITCAMGGDPVDCKPHVDRFKSRFDLCLSVNSTEQCINTVWADFKKSNSSCVAEASDYCLLKCEESMDTSWCLNKCN